MPDLERPREQALVALNRAALAITSELSLEKTLQQIVDSARTLVGARYAALGAFNDESHRRSQTIGDEFVFSGITPEEALRIAHRPEGLGLLGAILYEGQPIRIPRIAGDPRSVGFPPGHPAMTSFLGVPIVAGDAILGSLYLTDKIGADEFSRADEELIEILATHAAIAIKNARLYEQVGRLAIIEERSRIGMDLHDGVIQSIYAVGLTLESAQLLLAESPQAANNLLDQAISGLNDAIRDIRNFILDLRPQRFKGDLNQGLARLAREFQANAMVPVRLAAPPEILAHLPAPVARAIFLTTQEALANVARHARASNVTVEIQGQRGGVVLSVVDDGRGFDVDRQSQTVGHGLANMRARAENLNGTFTLHSAPGQGTSISLTLPL